MAQQHELRWDDTLPPFAGPGSELPDEGYAIEAMADGSNFGNPEALIEVVRSLLSDGSLAVLEGWDNRVAPIRLRISAPTAIAGPALADAEKALMAAVLRTPKAPLVYVPPAQDAETCVFDVVAAELTRDTSDGWDTDEHQREERYYLLTLTCLPFARTDEPVVVPALAPAPESVTTVSIDDGTSTSGWTREASQGISGPTVAGSAVTATGGFTSLADYLRLKRTGSVTMGATPYLGIDVMWTNDAPWKRRPTGAWAMTFDGVAHSPIATQIAQGESGSNRLFFEPPASFTTIGIEFAITSLGAMTEGDLAVYSIFRTDSIAGDTTTARQQPRSANVDGSAPTTASLRIWDATPGDLGRDILVHTSSNTDWQPNLRRWLVSTAGTPNSALVSGAANSLASPMVFRIPASNFTHGTYALMARRSGGPDTAIWEARMVDSAGADIIGSSVVASGSAELTNTVAGHEVASLGAVSLPVLEVEEDQCVELTLSTAGGTNAVDEVWLFGLHDGALTWIRDVDIDLQWIDIRSPELGASRPSVFGGTGELGSGGVCIDWACESFGAHRFDPGLMQIFTVTSTSLVSQSEIEFYPRYHSHVEGSSAV